MRGELSEAALADLLDAAPDGIVIVNSDGAIQYANHATGQLFGYLPDDLIGLPIERLVPGRLRARHAADRSAYHGEARRRPMGLGLRLQGLRADGTEVPVEISLAPLNWGEERSTIATVRDATEQRELEEERLRFARARTVEDIVAALDAIVWESTTPDRETLTYIGGRDEILLGYAPSSWLEAGFWLSIVHPDDRLAALTFAEAARERDTFELTYRVITAAGATRDMRDMVTVARGADGQVERLRGVITDVTERRELAERLGQAQKLEAVGQLAGGMAHDFNNLLTIVSGHTRRLMKRPDQAQAVDEFEQILAATDRAAELTHQLLTFARRGQTQAMLVGVNEVIRELEPMLRRLLAADIVFSVDLADRLPDVLIDRSEFEQIVMNLVLNASDAMPTGGILTIATAAVEIDGTLAEARGVEPGVFVAFIVTDDGPGIPAEVRERIFEPFFTTKGDRGTGMGLAAVHSTADHAGGWVDVDSTVGEGTRFEVLLPSSPATAPVPSPETGQRRTVLVVEDEPALRNLIVMMLEEEGYLVLRASNGYDAITVAERHRHEIDLLITDIIMPRVSGADLARQLGQLRPGLEVLFVSGSSDSRLVARGVEQAQANLLLKPFTPDQLIHRVRELAGSPQA